MLEERTELLSQGKWDEKNHSEARKKLLVALESSSFNAERVLQRLPFDGLYEERAFLLGRMRQHRLALTLYAHKVCSMNFSHAACFVVFSQYFRSFGVSFVQYCGKIIHIIMLDIFHHWWISSCADKWFPFMQLHESELALAYCDRVYTSATSGFQQHMGTLASLALRPIPKDTAAANIYLTLLEVYLKPEAAIKEFDRSIASLAPVANTINQRATAAPRPKGMKKIAQIEDGKGL